MSGSGQFEKMLEDIADPAESLLSSPDLGGNDSKTGSSHHDETLCGAYVTTVLEICLYLLVYYVAFNSLANRVFLRPDFMRRHGIRDEGVGMDFACKTVSACFALLAASLGAIILFTPSTSKKPEKTTNSSSLEGYDKSKSLLHQTVMHFMLFATAYFLYDMYAMYEVYLAKQRVLMNSGQSNGKRHVGKGHRHDIDSLVGSVCAFLLDNPIISAHHLVIALVFAPMSVSLVFAHEPGLLMLGVAFLLESSTPFVTFRSILADLGMKSGKIYLVNGLLLIAVFFLCRIAIYPIFYSVYAASRNITFMEALQVPPLSCHIYVSLTLLPQIYWFRLLIKGAFKTVSQYNSATDSATQSPTFESVQKSVKSD